MRRKSRPTANAAYRPSTAASAKTSGASVSSLFNSITLAILGGVFVIGVGVGIAFSSVASSGAQGTIASRDQLDQVAPSAQVCQEYGASAMVMDTRVFVTLNPVNFYTVPSKMEPGCVLRSSNFAVLEQRKLVTADQIRECRQHMNTFGFTGNLESSPQVSCIYQGEPDRNAFLKQPGVGAPPPEAERF